MRKIILIICGLFLISSLSVSSYAEANPSIDMPKVFLDAKYLQDNDLNESRLYDFLGSTVTLVKLGDGKTIVIGGVGKTVVVDKEIPGSFSEYQKNMATGNMPEKIKKSSSEPYMLQGLDSIGIPLFLLKTGFISMKSGSTYISLATWNDKRGIRVTVDGIWQKKLLSDGMAIYITKLSFFNKKSFQIKELPLNYSLRSETGQIYPAIKSDSGLFSKIRSKFFGQNDNIPKECKNSISDVSLTPFEKSNEIACIIAPADDFSLSAYFGGPVQEIRHKPEFQPGANWKKQFPFSYMYNDNEKILSKYLNRVKASLTKEGYNKNLSILSYIYFKLGNHNDSLIISEHLLNTNYTSKIIPLKLLKVLNLIYLNRLASAIIAIHSDKDLGVPGIYRQYLINSCLQIAELLDEAARVDLKADFRARIYKAFLRLTKLTPDVDDKIIAQIKRTILSQEQQFQEAFLNFKNQNYYKARMILEFLASQNIRGKSLGPTILDLLARTYELEKEYSKALDTYKKMERDYPEEEAIDPFAEGLHYCGPGGAKGLRGQLIIYVVPYWKQYMADLKPDCNKALETAERLIMKYPGIIDKRSNGYGTYSDLAIFLCKTCLIKTSTSTVKIEEKITKLLNLVTKEDDLIVKTKAFLAKKYQNENDYMPATRIYREIVKKFPKEYITNDMKGKIEFYGLDALVAIMEMQYLQNFDVNEINKTRKEFKVLYKSFQNKTGKKFPDYLKMQMKKKYSKYLLPIKVEEKAK
jgi:tetratricopeptide (TPR) repeat protein